MPKHPFTPRFLTLPALQTWLFTYELSDTLIVFLENRIVVLASSRKLEFLKPLEKLYEDGDDKENALASIEFLLRNKVVSILGGNQLLDKFGLHSALGN